MGIKSIAVECAWLYQASYNKFTYVVKIVIPCISQIVMEYCGAGSVSDLMTIWFVMFFLIICTSEYDAKSTFYF